MTGQLSFFQAKENLILIPLNLNFMYHAMYQGFGVTGIPEASYVSLVICPLPNNVNLCICQQLPICPQHILSYLILRRVDQKH